MSYFDDIDLRTNTGSYNPTNIMQAVEEAMAETKTSQEKWESMPTDEHELLRASVLHTLDKLVHNIDDWLPSSLVFEEGAYMDVKFKIMFATKEEHEAVNEEWQEELRLFREWKASRTS